MMYMCVFVYWSPMENMCSALIVFNINKLKDILGKLVE